MNKNIDDAYMAMDCGCEFKIGPDGLPIFDPLFANLNLECPKTWDLICDGNTVGCFQIESRLGRSTCKKARPRNIQELSDVVTIIRPACLEAKLDDDKSIYKHYIERKNGREPVTYFHPSLEDILRDTYGLLLTQEQTIRIGVELGGMTESMSDTLLRKGVGKKLAHVIKQAKTEFINGAERVGKISREEAEEIFSWIEKGARYGFNRSHAVSYAATSYITAYAKTHFLHRFYTSYLNHAQDKQKPLVEHYILSQNAKQNCVDVCTPDIRRRNLKFALIDDKIYFGITNIKSIGENAALDTLQQLPADIGQLGFTECLFKYMLNCRNSTIKILISTGAFDFLNVPRKKMLFFHENCLTLKKKELEYIIENADVKADSIVECLKVLADAPSGKGECFANKRRKATVADKLINVRNPPMKLEDKIEEISAWEQSYLGTAITCTIFDTIGKQGMEITCDDFEKQYVKKGTIIGKINRINEVITKDDEEMAFACIGDDTGEIDSVVLFPRVWSKYRGLIEQVDILRFTGYKNDDSFILTRCEEPVKGQMR